MPETAVGRAARGQHVARLDEGLVHRLPGRHLLLRQPAELVHVELVVREQDVVLEVLGVGAGVVQQAVQRVVDALGGEGRERHGHAGLHLVRAVDDVVVHVRDVRHVERVAQGARQHRGALVGEGAAGLQREVERNGDVRDHDLDRVPMALDQQLELMHEIAVEEPWMRDGGGVAPRPIDVTVGQHGFHARPGVVAKAHLGVEGAVLAGLQVPRQPALERRREEAGVRVVELDQAIHRLARVAKLPRFEGLWRDRGRAHARRTGGRRRLARGPRGSFRPRTGQAGRRAGPQAR